MVYNANTPNVGDPIKTTQPIIRANFQSISAAFSANHVDFNDSNQGKHKYLQMPVQATNPSTSAAEGAVYTKDVGGGETQLFYRRESNGVEMQLTYSNFQANIKAAVKFAWSSSSIITYAACNCAVTRESKGIYVVTYTQPFQDNFYFWSVNGAHDTNNSTICTIRNPTSSQSDYSTATSLTVQFTNQNGSLVDPIIACVTVFGV